MESTEIDRAIEELTLLLLYLTSWEEELVPGAPRVHRTWKNHRFEALDALVEKGYLDMTHRAKSVHITKDGVEKARELQKKYLGS
ncbi:MAG TPA: DUF6429 family protein [Candidatus Heimdallarchaeota archaeon]|nr:DUF6429 family protein [Candidatus Heimdallarchaeota archaeon]